MERQQKKIDGTAVNTQQYANSESKTDQEEWKVESGEPRRRDFGTAAEMEHLVAAVCTVAENVMQRSVHNRLEARAA